MAWKLGGLGLSIDFGDGVEILDVQWNLLDTVNDGIRRVGHFKHTLDDNKTWAQNKDDVKTRIRAGDGEFKG